MSEQLDHNEIRKFLCAFADGELDVEQNLRVLEQLAMDPRTTHRVMHQHQLRQAVKRAMARPSGAPAALREKMSGLLDAGSMAEPGQGETPDAPAAPAGDAAEQRPPASSASLAPHATAGGTTAQGSELLRWNQPSTRRKTLLAAARRWTPLAAAALLLIAAIALWIPGRGGPAGLPGPRSHVLSASLLNHFEVHHVRCAQHPRGMHPGRGFPSSIKALPRALHRFFHLSGKVGGLDLSRLGYQYQVAGICPVPSRHAVHVFYRRADRSADRYGALSLWIAPRGDAGETPLALSPGKLYDIAGADWPHPIVVWRSGGLVYYLVGDSTAAVKQAAALLQSQEPPEPDGARPS